jgi:hypothetical protein
MIALVLLGAGLAAPRAASAAPSLGLPCDLDAAGGTPCVAAYSTVRTLDSAYTGPLYEVTRASDGSTLNISAEPDTGVADAMAQEQFCQGTTCTITRLYDQSGEGNDLTVAAGAAGTPDLAASATALPVQVDGQLAYGLDVTPGVGYRDDATSAIATGAEPQSVYMVTSSNGTDDHCCFDFGNSENHVANDGDGHMDAVNFSSRCVRPGQACNGIGPWVQADLEDGLFESNRGVSDGLYDPPINEPFVTAMLENNGQNFFALSAANAQLGPLTTLYSGGLPDFPGGVYIPMQQEGGIVLGIGGDNSRGGSGEFFEGVLTAGIPSAAISTAIQGDIVSAGYVEISAPAPLPLPSYVADAPQRVEQLLATARFWTPHPAERAVVTVSLATHAARAR